MVCKTFIASTVFLLMSVITFAQDCPADEDDLADGGTWTGPVCPDIDVDGNISIDGVVHWSAGAIELYNSNPGGTANLVITSTGFLIIGSGTISFSGRIILNAGGTINVQSDGTLTGNGTGDSEIRGTLNSNGTVSIDGDLAIDGGTVNVNAGVFNVGITPDGDADLQVYNGGKLNVYSGSTVNVEDDFENTTTSGNPSFADEASFHIEGVINVHGDVNIFATTPSSELVGFAAGTINVDGRFYDDACPYPYANSSFDFCACNSLDNVSCSATLPVALVDFSGTQINNVVRFEWTTASEIDNDYFALERLEKNDAFEEITRVNGNGNTQVMHFYVCHDTNPVQGANYYRLKQTDYDGKISYSSLIRVDFASEIFSLNVFPNPAEKEFCTIEILNARPLQQETIGIKNSHGFLVYSHTIASDEKGSISIQLPLADFAPGMYFVSSHSENVKFIVR